MREDDIQTTNNILDLSSSLEFNNSGVIKGEIEIDNIFELENNIEILVQDKIIEPTKETQTVMVDEDYDQLGTVTVNPIPDEYIIPDGTLDVDANGDVDVTMFRMARVGVYTPPVLQDKEVIPTKEEQIIRYDEDYDGLSEVKVSPIPNEYIIPNGTMTITENGNKDVTHYTNVDVNIHPKLQNKTIGIIENGTHTITSDDGYDGLNIVEVTTNVSDPNAIFEILEWRSDGPGTVKLAEGLTGIPGCFTPKSTSLGFGAYIKKLILPSTLVRLYENALENYSSLVEINIDNVTQFYNGVFKSCSSLKSITLSEGINTGTSFSRNPNKLQHSMFDGCSNLEHVDIPSSIIGLGYRCFAGCSNLIMDELPEGITEMGPGYLPSGGYSESGRVFQGCSKITFSKLPDGLISLAGMYNFSGCSNITISALPDGITKLAGYNFYKCTSITTFNTNNVQTINNSEFSGCTSLVSVVMPKLVQNNASSQSYSVFQDCTALKAAWIGSSVTKLTIYTFRNCPALQKIYIDLPRATASTLAGYAKGYTYDVDNSAKVVYNDDAGFITQAEFEAIDWSNYTE